MMWKIIAKRLGGNMDHFTALSIFTRSSVELPYPSLIGRSKGRPCYSGNDRARREAEGYDRAKKELKSAELGDLSNVKDSGSEIYSDDLSVSSFSGGEEDMRAKQELWATKETASLEQERNSEILLKLEADRQMRAKREYAHAGKPGGPSASTVTVRSGVDSGMDPSRTAKRGMIDETAAKTPRHVDTDIFDPANVVKGTGPNWGDWSRKMNEKIGKETMDREKESLGSESVVVGSQSVKLEESSDGEPAANYMENLVRDLESQRARWPATLCAAPAYSNNRDICAACSPARS